jgi:hypothetical protein
MNEQPLIGRFERALILICLLLFVPFVAWLQISLFSGEIKDWIAPTPILSLTGLIIGFLMLSYQLERQHQNTVESNRLEAEARLKLDVYREILARIEVCRKPLIQLMRAPHVYKELEKGYKDKDFASTLADDPLTRCMALSQLADEVTNNTIPLTDTLFYYQQALPKDLEKLKSVLSLRCHDLEETVSDFVRELTPSGKADSSVTVSVVLTKNSEKMHSLSECIQKAAGEVHGAIEDLRVECQNFLLDSVFPGKGTPKRFKGVLKIEVLGMQKCQKKESASPDHETPKA